MASFDVKITTKCGILDMLCPHFCRGCGAVGTILCDCCKNYIITSNFNHCPKCHKAIDKKCNECELPFVGTFVVGWRDELLGDLVKEFKFESVRALGGELAEILERKLPKIAGEVVVVPLPTVAKHVRERGMDHTLIIAKKLAKRRGWKVERLLVRAKNTVQVGATAEQRQAQAKEAYEFRGKIRKNVTYLLLDDVWTTGASMLAAAETMQKAGAKKMIAAVLVANRQQSELEKLKLVRGAKSGIDDKFDDGVSQKTDD